MKKTKFDYKQLCNIICILLTLVMVALMFTPFWVYPEKEVDASMSDYLWFTWEQKDLEKLMKEWVGGKDNYMGNSYIAALFFGFVFGAIAVIAGALKRKTLWGPIMGFAAGGWMVWGLATQPVFQAQYVQNYGLHFGIALAVFLVCTATLVLNIVVKLVENYKKNEKYRQFNKAMQEQ